MNMLFWVWDCRRRAADGCKRRLDDEALIWDFSCGDYASLMDEFLVRIAELLLLLFVSIFSLSKTLIYFTYYCFC